MKVNKALSAGDFNLLSLCW